MCCCENNHAIQEAEVESPERRKVLGRLVALINIVVFSSVLGPVVGFIAGPIVRKRQFDWITVGQLDEFVQGETKEVRFSYKLMDGYRIAEHRQSIYLRRDSDQIVAFNPSCTHLGCKVRFMAEKDRFFCPCHGGVFDANGNVVSGPPPKPLNRYEARVERQKVQVRLEV